MLVDIGIFNKASQGYFGISKPNVRGVCLLTNYK